MHLCLPDTESLNVDRHTGEHDGEDEGHSTINEQHNVWTTHAICHEVKSDDS